MYTACGHGGFIADEYTSGPDPKEVQHAKELCEDLLTNVREQYEEFKARGPPQRGYDRPPSTGYGGQRGYGDRQERSNSYGAGYGGYNSPAPAGAGLMSPGGAPGAASPAAGADYAAQYAQYYGGADPYAAYGGYAAYAQYYQQYMAAAQAAQQQAPPGPPGSEQAPPPPPSEAPPPPPGGAPSAGPPGVNGYNAVR